METDIGNPIDYNPVDDPFKEKEEKFEDSTPINEEQYYFQPPETMYPPQQQFNAYPTERNDFFSNVDKSVWIIAFAVFLLGFFMGKTMQPVILRYAWVPSEIPRVPINWNDFSCDVTIHNLGRIHRNNERVACILDESMCRIHLNFPTFVSWIHNFTWFKKQNKERACQNNG